MNIKYSEIFASFQGEAGFAGMPTLWLRFYGCNLECNGFGQKDPTDETTWELPYKTLTINKSKYRKLEDLPVFEYGCDSSYSWSKKYDEFAHKESEVEVVEKLLTLGLKSFGLTLENKDFWRHPKTRQHVQLCFTGGEPMLWQKQMLAILSELNKQNRAPLFVTIETNGTIKPDSEFLDAADDMGIDVYFSVSPKLRSVSGEKNAIKYDVLKYYASGEENGWFKFVINGTEESWNELDSILDEIGYNALSTWIMPVGATKEQQEAPSVAAISDEAMRRGFNVATRNHVAVYGNSIGK